MGAKGGVLRYADNVDKLLVVFGTLGSFGNGLMWPLTLNVISGMINNFSSESQLEVTFDAARIGDQIKQYVSLDLLAVEPNYSAKRRQCVAIFYPSWDYDSNQLALKLLYISVGVALAGFIEGVCWTRTAERQTSRMRVQYLKSLLRQDVAFFDNKSSSSSPFEVVTGITIDAENIQDAISEKVPHFVSSTATYIACFIVSFTLSWKLALFTLPLILLFLVPMLGLGKVMMRVSLKMKDAYGVAGEIAEQAISSIRTVYSFVGEQQTLIRFSHALESYTGLGIKQGLIKGLLIGSAGMIYVNIGFQSLIGGILVTENGENGGNVYVAGLCVIIGGVQLMTAFRSIPFLIEAKVAASRINEMIGRIPLIDSEDNNGETKPKIRGDIEFTGVYFSYPSRPDSQILSGFGLTMKSGETIGLVGPSGSGKSTIISLLERFYDPVKGDILLDGQNIKTFQLRWLRSQMGLVSQEPILFATSIKDNILIGNEEATADHVVAAARAANAHNFISKLPKGYDTNAGQFGSQLSGGQKQRIAIARALLRDPKILLLDEATSALDAQSEKIVQEALDQASIGRTTIIITHRLTTVQKANNIAVLQSGMVLEMGSHDELMENKNGQGAYFKMVQLQQASATKNETIEKHYSPLHVLTHRRTRSFSTLHAERLGLQGCPPYVPDKYLPVVNNKGEKLKTEKSIKNSAYEWRLLKMSVPPHWKRVLLGCIGAIGVGAIQPCISVLRGLLMSVYLQTDKGKIKSGTRTYALLFMGLGIVNLIVNVLLHYNFATMGERFTNKVRENMLQKLLMFEVAWFDREENSSAAISARLATDANKIKSLVGERISLVVQVLTDVSICCTVGLVVAWRLAIVVIAMQPLLILSFHLQKNLLKKTSKDAKKAQAKASQLASEATTNHKTITAFSSQGRILNLFAASLEHPRKENNLKSWYSGLGLFISNFFVISSLTMTFWYGFRLIDKGVLEPEPLFLAVNLFMSMGKSIADAASETSDLSKGIDSIVSLFSVVDRKSEIEPDEPEGTKAEESLMGEIEMKNVFFSYPSRPDQMILNGLSLKINAGKTCALVGMSGSGKSTVIGLIERFYDPSNGSILVDNQDIKSYNLRSLRSHIALVSQEPTLFAGTIRQNILYGKEDATDSELTEATTLANANVFISSMKDGYETYCGDKGVQLSGGQKQRIALARAILKNPKILLLDEATSALDSESESLVQESLQKMMVGRTSIVIAHRLSTIQNSDEIFVIENGKVVEQGSHSELLAAGEGGAYRFLVQLQNNLNQ